MHQRAGARGSRTEGERVTVNRIDAVYLVDVTALGRLRARCGPEGAVSPHHREEDLPGTTHKT